MNDKTNEWPYRSYCCDSDLIYVVGENFKIDFRNSEEINNIPNGAMFNFECGECDKACVVYDKQETNE